ncbi:MAG: hypothetical protein WC655_30125 [Candidatus Hydrogenedentales bacterium]|jgi:hypothetical protein
MGLFRAESKNETDFDFAHAEPIRIEGLKYPAMYKFTHVIQEDGQWCMYFAEFVRPGCKGCCTGYATSKDGLRWQARNTRLLLCHDAEILKVDTDLYSMYFGPDGYFDQKDGFRQAIQQQVAGPNHGSQDIVAGITFPW